MTNTGTSGSTIITNISSNNTANSAVSVNSVQSVAALRPHHPDDGIDSIQLQDATVLYHESLSTAVTITAPQSGKTPPIQTHGKFPSSHSSTVIDAEEAA